MRAHAGNAGVVEAAFVALRHIAGIGSHQRAASGAGASADIVAAMRSEAVGGALIILR
jgi:hypothetical protein